MKGNKGKKKNKNEPKVIIPEKKEENKDETSSIPKSIQEKENKILLSVHAKPGAKKEGVCLIDDECIEIAVHAQAQNNKANFALIEYLSDILNLSKNSIQFESGATNRDKQISVTGITSSEIYEKLKKMIITM